MYRELEAWSQQCALLPPHSVLIQDLSASLIEVANGKAQEAAEAKAANQLRAQIEELYKYVLLRLPVLRCIAHLNE